MAKGKARPAYGIRKPTGGAGGGGGGGGGMAGQLQRLQEEFARTQERLGDETVEVTVGGGAVKAVMTGHQKLLSVTISPDVVDPEGKPLDTWLRELNAWVVKFQLQTVPGVTDILSIGGHVLQYQIRVNPSALLQYALTLEDLVAAVNANNRNVGGQFLVLGSEEHLVRGVGLVESLEDLRNVAVKDDAGRPILLSDVAEVEYGNEIRRGAKSSRAWS